MKITRQIPMQAKRTSLVPFIRWTIIGVCVYVLLGIVLSSKFDDDEAHSDPVAMEAGEHQHEIDYHELGLDSKSFPDLPLSVVPKPKVMKRRGTNCHYHLCRHTCIVYDYHNAESKTAAELLASYLRDSTGLELPLKSDRMVDDWNHSIHIKSTKGGGEQDGDGQPVTPTDTDKDSGTDQDNEAKEGHRDARNSDKQNKDSPKPDDEDTGAAGQETKAKHPYVHTYDHNHTTGPDRLIRDESYVLKATSTKIVLTAPTPSGLFYGIQTLRQLLPVSALETTYAHRTSIDDSVNAISSPDYAIPCVIIRDAPAFHYRGAHLDVARHMTDVPNIKRFIDLMAFHKLNVLHLQLTDDQGWRFEVKSHPKLHQIGAVRNETEGDGKRYDGYLTQEECKDLVAYAKTRQVHILPEIEIPGHVRALLAAYPLLGNTVDDPVTQVGTEWEYKDTLTIGPTEQALSLLKDVLGEVLDVFPFEYVHVGFQQVTADDWAKNSDVVKMAEESYDGEVIKVGKIILMDIHEFLVSHKRKTIGWDGILDYKGVVPGTTAMAYRDRRTHRAARADLNVINCHRRYTYLDYSQSEFRLREPKAQAYLPLERAYRYSPIPYDLDPQYHHKVLGGQAQLFTEYITSWAHLMYMAYPRTCAIADRLWNTNGTTDYDEFKERLAIHLDRLKALGVNYRQPDEIQTTA